MKVDFKHFQLINAYLEHGVKRFDVGFLSNGHIVQYNMEASSMLEGLRSVGAADSLWTIMYENDYAGLTAWKITYGC